MVSAPQKPKAVDTPFVAPVKARDGRTAPLSGTQVLRTQHHFSVLDPVVTTGDRGATLMSDVVKSNDAVEPVWSDRAPEDGDVTFVAVIPGANNPGH
jgi:hypothetical protein